MGDFITQLEKDFAALGRGRAEPAWLAGLRRQGWEAYQKTGLPTTDLEAWRHTSVEPLKKIPFESTVPSPTSKESEKLEGDLGRLIPLGEHPFAAINTALFSDVRVIRIPKGTATAKSIEIVYEANGNGRASAVHPRTLIILEPGSQATVVESYRGSGPGLINAVTEVILGEGSSLEHYTLQETGPETFHVGNLQVRQERGSHFTSHAVSIGGCWSRTDLGVLLDAEGAECALNGLYYAHGTQHVDFQTNIDHARPHGTSRELYKGILDDRATGVFNGRIVVRPNAEKTNARQVNKNLLLSDEAIVNTKPLLEILNNDVKCNHGATIGRLDANQLFYLRSRGIGASEAEAILVSAFAGEMIGLMKLPAIGERLRGRLRERLC